jgi:hypothetical protein
MINPLRSIDRWASQSGDRAALLLWLVVIMMVVFVILAVAGLIWYTAPPRTNAQAEPRAWSARNS